MKLEQFFLSALASEATQVAQASLSLMHNHAEVVNTSYLDQGFCRVIAITKMMHYHQIPLSMHVGISTSEATAGMVESINQFIAQTYLALGDLIKTNNIQLTAAQIKSIELGIGLSLGNEYPL